MIIPNKLQEKHAWPPVQPNAEMVVRAVCVGMHSHRVSRVGKDVCRAGRSDEVAARVPRTGAVDSPGYGVAARVDANVFLDVGLAEIIERRGRIAWRVIALENRVVTDADRRAMIRRANS